MKENKVEKFIKNPKKALYTLAYPIIIALTVQTLYNVVDTAFVGRLGADAIAALTFSFPLFFILIALNQTIAVGMGSRISRYLGAKNKSAAENTALHGLYASLILAVIAFILGIIFQGQLFALTGATGLSLTLAIQYMSIILLGVFLMFPTFVLTTLFSSQGDTKTSMKIHLSAVVLNIILDPIFIYVLGYGVQGAAIATLCAFGFSLGMSMYYVKKKSYLSLNFKSFNYSKKILKDIFRVGAPVALNMLLVAFYVMFINRLMAHFGTTFVAAFGIASKLHNLAIMPVMAFGTALMVLVGMFYGAKRFDLIKQIISYAIKRLVLFASITAILFFIFATPLLRIFTADPNLLNISAAYLRIDVITFPLVTMTVLITRAMQGMGFGLPGLIISSTRILFVAVPLAYIAVFILGFNYLSIPISTIIGVAIADVIALVWIFSKMKKFKVDNKSYK